MYYDSKKNRKNASLKGVKAAVKICLRFCFDFNNTNNTQNLSSVKMTDELLDKYIKVQNTCDSFYSESAMRSFPSHSPSQKMTAAIIYILFIYLLLLLILLFESSLIEMYNISISL